MHTVVVDSKRRIRLPETKPQQVYAYERQGDGCFLLTRLEKRDLPEPFPRGSLAKYLTQEKADEELALSKACSLEIPE